MKVADLQRLLGAVGPFARSAGASEKAGTELDRVAQCFEPFKEKSLAEFSEFLQRADEFDRTGKLTPPAASGRARAGKAGSLSVDDAAKIITDLLARATDPTLGYADIEVALKPVGKMTIAQLVEVAAKVDVPVPPKGKPAILAALTRRITELKASGERMRDRFSA